jgi:hypothetical protein
VFEKEPNQIGGHVSDREPIHSLPRLSRDKGNKEGYGIAIATLSVTREVTFADEVFEQKSADPGPKKR